MKTKFFMFILVIVVFSGVLFSSASFSASFSSEDTAEVRALNDLFSYVRQNEIINADIRWILDSFERFDRERSWGNLLLARASAEIAGNDIRQCSLPELEMTSEDRQELMRRNIDLTAMSGMDTSFKAEQITALTTFKNLAANIMYDVFLKKDWEVSMMNVRMLKKLTDCNIRYLACTVDAVLVSIHDEALKKAFMKELEKHCPMTFAYTAKKTVSQEEIKASLNNVLNQIERIAVEGTKIVGAKNDRYNFVKDALDRNDLKLLARDINVISGMPSVIFAPSWFSNEDIHYYWHDNGRILPDPKARTELSGIPESCRIRIKGVTLESVKSYQNDLEKAGLTFSRTSNENEIVCDYGGSVFSITWKNGTAEILMIENPFCFVPLWYVPALHSLRQ